MSNTEKKKTSKKKVSQKHSKRFLDVTSKIEKKQTFTIEEAITFLKENSTVKFDESVELHMNLGIDPRKGDQLVRGTLVLPHGTGKTKKVIVFAEGEAATQAKEAGADEIGSDELIAEIKKTGKCDFDEAIATPDMMKKLGPIAKILGTKGLMPNPKKETVTPNVAKAIKDVKGGKIAFRNDNTANLHQIVGKLSFDTDKLVENISTFIDTIEKLKPTAQKGIYLKSITLSSSMGPGLRVVLEA